MKNYEGFLGCFPYDKLPKLKGNNKHWSIIINTGKSGTAGEHWVALKRKGDKCFYFDSFGLPIVNKSIMDFIKNSKKYIILKYVFKILVVLNAECFVLYL